MLNFLKNILFVKEEILWKKVKKTFWDILFFNMESSK
jgi:hypothetical protein